MHPLSNTPFLRNGTLFSVNKLEVEANQFAIDLLIDDIEFKDLLENNMYTLNNLSDYYGVNLEIIEYKLKRLYKSER